MTEAQRTPSRRKGRRAGIRTRITAVSVGAVALALVIGAIGFWLTLRSSLYEQLDLATRQDAAAFAEQADQVGEDALPDVDDDRFWQLIDRDSGSVVAGSDLVEDLSAIADRDGNAPAFVSLGSDGVFAVAAERESGDVVVAGRSTSTIEETLGSVAMLLTAAVPLIALIVGITTWIAVGRALAPVDRMRRQVDAVTASDLSQRVEDPARAMSWAGSRTLSTTCWGGSRTPSALSDDSSRMPRTSSSRPSPCCASTPRSPPPTPIASPRASSPRRCSTKDSASSGSCRACSCSRAPTSTP